MASFLNRLENFFCPAVSRSFESLSAIVFDTLSLQKDYEYENKVKTANTPKGRGYTAIKSLSLRRQVG